MRVLLLSVLLSLSIAALAAPKNGTLKGRVTIGPMSPVEHPGQQETLNPARFKGMTIVITAPGPQNGQMKSHMLRLVKKLPLSSTGQFSVSLPPGTYRVDLNSETQFMHMPQAQTVVVKARKTTSVAFSIDTGIR